LHIRELVIEGYLALTLGFFDLSMVLSSVEIDLVFGIEMIQLVVTVDDSIDNWMLLRTALLLADATVGVVLFILVVVARILLHNIFPMCPNG
jgi:hypothetical protein